MRTNAKIHLALARYQPHSMIEMCAMRTMESEKENCEEGEKEAKRSHLIQAAPASRCCATLFRGHGKLWPNGSFSSLCKGRLIKNSI